ncbi:type IV conjugative transfer system protein TraL [Escherichia coli]|nr:type IV conjugative transfer system protein TraL [Escherichia coli]
MLTNQRPRWFGLPLITDPRTILLAGTQHRKSFVLCGGLYFGIKKLKKRAGQFMVRDLIYWYMPTASATFIMFPIRVFRQWIK